MHLATLTLALLLLTAALAGAQDQQDQQDTYNAMVRENEVEDAGSRDLTSADKDLLAVEPRRLKKMLEAEAHPRERRGLKMMRKGLRRVGHKVRKMAGSQRGSLGSLVAGNLAG